MSFDLNEALEKRYFKEEFPTDAQLIIIDDNSLMGTLDQDIVPIEDINQIISPEGQNVPCTETTCCPIETATQVMDAYQSANKWLDIIKEAVYIKTGCVFFSSYIHEMAHTMPVRFDKFGDILHTVNMKIPYPATAYIPQEPTDINGAFTGIFMILENIKIALNAFIKCTDDEYHGMSCAAEALLNDIEGEYPMLYRLQQEWTNCAGDMAKFDKYVGQYMEHKDSLLA